MRYRYILLDLDETILDFKKTEEAALQAVFARYGILLSMEQVQVYNDINDRYWKQYEKGTIAKETLKSARFADYVAWLGAALPASPAELNLQYMQELGSRTIVIPGVEEVICKLAQHYPLYIITNGTTSVQKGRLKNLSCRDCFQKVYISDELGSHKPEPAFFEAITADLHDTDPTHYLIVGDSLTSDIALGKQVSADTCLVWRGEAKPPQAATYTISHLRELLPILGV